MENQRKFPLGGHRPDAVAAGAPGFRSVGASSRNRFERSKAAAGGGAPPIEERKHQHWQYVAWVEAAPYVLAWWERRSG